MDEIKKAWDEGRERGEGFAACDCNEENCGCDINTLSGYGRLLRSSGPTDDGLALYQDHRGAVTAVGDVCGPFAVIVLPGAW